MIKYTLFKTWSRDYNCYEYRCVANNSEGGAIWSPFSLTEIQYPVTAEGAAIKQFNELIEKEKIHAEKSKENKTILEAEI